MRRVLIAAFAAFILGIGLVWTQPTEAWLAQAPATGAAYTGPGDIVTFQDWVGLRAYNQTLANAGASTTKVIDVLGATTATSCTIFLLGNGTGELDFSTAGAGGTGNQCALGATTFCTVTNTSCTIAKWYDQAGSLPFTTIAADQATLSISCQNSRPCAVANSSTTYNTSGSSTISFPVSFSSVAKFTGGAQGGLFIDQPSAVQLGYRNSGANTVFLYDGAGGLFSATASDNAFHALQFAVISGTSTIYVDGSATTGATTVSLITEPFKFIGAGNAMPGSAMEFGIAASQFSTPNMSSLNSNQRTYWNF